MIIFRSTRSPFSSLKILPKRRNVYTVAQEPHFASIDVKCGGSGITTIHIHNPPKATPLPLLLYVSPTTDPRALTFPSIPPCFLSKSHTTVLIRPLFSSATPFPQPLHVLSYAYEEILKQHLKLADSGELPLPTISVYGKGLGGTLASALALTECRPMNKIGAFVDSVMSRDAIYDYSPLANEYLSNHASKKPEKEMFSMHDYLSPDSDLAYANPPSNAFISGPSISTPTEDIAASDIKTRENLIKSLPHLFSRPEIAFDPFISPILFFRGRSHEIPTGWTWHGPPGGRSDISLAEHGRRSYVKFPPKDSGLRIPWARLCVTASASAEEKVVKKSKKGKAAKGSAMKIAELTTVYGENVHPTRDGERELQSLYAGQADLMAAGMRRAIEKEHEDHHLLFNIADYDASERVQVVHVPDVGDERENDEMDGVAMREWQSEVPGWR